MKIDLAKVAEVLKRNRLEPATIRRIVEELGLAAAVAQPEAAGDGAPAPKLKTQFVILATKAVADAPQVGWVLQLEEGAAPADVVARIQKAAYDYNASKKGRLYPVKTMGEAIESVPRALWKREDGKTLVKTKSPVQVIITDNELPRA